ncbi:MAG: redoxin family protein [Parvularculaceae bacterium]
MAALKSPRFWLVVWAGLGAALVLYVMIAASVKPGDRGAGAPLRDAGLLKGEIAKFEFAVPARGVPLIAFEHEGRSLTLAEFKGKTILVNFWATWCPPCVRELPSLDALQAEFGEKGFEVVAIATGPQGKVAPADFFARLGVKNLRLYADPQLRLASTIGGGSVLPVSILYDAQGREIGRLIGEADWASPEARRLIERAIGAS